MINIKVKTILNMKNCLGGLNEQIVQIPFGSSIEDLINYLISTYGKELEKELFDEPLKIKQGRAMFVNGVNIFAKQGLNMILNDGDEFLIFPPVAGG